MAVASFLLAKPIRNGLFFEQYGAARLVYVYAAVPLVLAVLVPLYSRVASRVGQRAVITGSLLFFASNVLAFWYGFRYTPRPWLSVAFYLWVNCYGVVAPVQAWSFANSVFDTRQARRLFGLVGAGASAGAILGGFLAQSLTGVVGTVNLLLVLSALILSAALVVNLAWGVRRRDARPTAPPRAVVPFRRTLVEIAGSPYLRLMALVVFLTAVVTQATQFQFSVVVEQRFGGDADRITRFFGMVNTYMGVVAFFTQVLLTGPALRRFGVGATLLFLPLALALGSLWVALAPVFVAVLMTSVLDQGLRFSIDKASFELLYLPIPSAQRGHIKSSVDVIVNRLGDGLGGVWLGLLTSGFTLASIGLPGAGLGIRGIAMANLLLIGVWLAAAWQLRRGYVEAIQESIRSHRLEAERASMAALDRTAAKALSSQLVAADSRDILYALSVFEAERGRSVHTAVRDLLRHPLPEIRRRALQLLDDAGDVSVLPAVEAMLDDEDIDTRTDALLYLSRHSDVDPLSRVDDVGAFGDVAIRAGLVAFLSRVGPRGNPEAARAFLESMVAESSEAGVRTRREAAKLLRILPQSFDDLLEPLLDDPAPEVRREAVLAAGARRDPRFATILVRRLNEPDLAAVAAEALAQLGEAVVPLLAAVLNSDSETDHAVKREVPTALARIGTPTARDALTDHLLVADPQLRSRVIVALNKHVRSFPDLPIDVHAVEMVLTAEVLGHYRSYQLLGSLTGAFDDRTPVVGALRTSMEQEVERIFRLLGLLWPDRDLHSAYVGVWSERASVRANAVEFLDNVLAPHLRSLIVPLFDPQIGMLERVARANRLLGTAVESQSHAIETLLSSADPWLRSCGAYAAGVRELRDLRPRLEALTLDSDALVRETALTSLRRLDASGGSAAEVADTDVKESGVFKASTELVGLG